MTPKQRKRMKICLIILAVSMAVMAISTVIQIVHNGWGTSSAINIVPFSGAAVVMIVMLGKDKKKDGEE